MSPASLSEIYTKKFFKSMGMEHMYPMHLKGLKLGLFAKIRVVILKVSQIILKVIEV